MDVPLLAQQVTTTLNLQDDLLPSVQREIIEDEAANKRNTNTWTKYICNCARITTTTNLAAS